MLRKKAMAKKHIQIARNCIRKAKQAKRRERRKFWLDMAKKQTQQAEYYTDLAS